MKTFNENKELVPAMMDASKLLTNFILSQKVSVAQILFTIIINILCSYTSNFIPTLITNFITISVIFMLNNGFYFAVFQLKKGNVSQIGCFGLQPDSNEFKRKEFVNEIFDPFSYDSSKYLSDGYMKRKSVFSPVNFEGPLTKCSASSTPTLTTAQSAFGTTKSSKTTVSSLNTVSSFINSNQSNVNMSIPVSLSDPLTTVTSSITTISKPCSSLSYSMSTSVNSTLPTKPSFASSNLISTSFPRVSQNQSASDFNSCDTRKSSIENIEIENNKVFSEQDRILKYDISNADENKLSNLTNEITKLVSVSSQTNISNLMPISPKFSGCVKEYKSFKYKFKTFVNHLQLKDCEKALLLFFFLCAR